MIIEVRFIEVLEVKGRVRLEMQVGDNYVKFYRY